MKKSFKYLLIFFIIANIFTYWIILDFLCAYRGEVSFLSVGQGDAQLIQIPGGNILIDAGPDAKILSELDKLLPFYDRTIDLFILSHPNKDHFNGLFDILERYKVRAVMLNNLSYSNSLFQKLLQELDKREILIIKGIAGVNVSWENQDNLAFLYPETMVSSKQDPNKFSSVNMLFLGQNCFLFTGDIGFAQEKKILPLLSCPDNNSRILKVPHHGSRYSSSAQFLEEFKPQVAIIEVGENSYGHPHPDTLERLKNIGAQIFRVDLDGTISFRIE